MITAQGFDFLKSSLLYAWAGNEVGTPDRGIEYANKVKMIRKPDIFE